MRLLLLALVALSLAGCGGDEEPTVTLEQTPFDRAFSGHRGRCG